MFKFGLDRNSRAIPFFLNVKINTFLQRVQFTGWTPVYIKKNRIYNGFLKNTTNLRFYLAFFDNCVINYNSFFLMSQLVLYYFFSPNMTYSRNTLVSETPSAQWKESETSSAFDDIPVNRTCQSYLLHRVGFSLRHKIFRNGSLSSIIGNASWFWPYSGFSELVLILDILIWNRNAPLNMRRHAIIWIRSHASESWLGFCKKDGRMGGWQWRVWL